MELVGIAGHGHVIVHIRTAHARLFDKDELSLTMVFHDLVCGLEAGSQGG
jgi:hypothetical protein